MKMQKGMESHRKKGRKEGRKERRKEGRKKVLLLIYDKYKKESFEVTIVLSM